MGAIPELEFLALTDQHDVFIEFRILPEKRRDEQAAGAVHVHVRGEADEAPLQFAYTGIEVRDAFELLLDQLPIRKRVDEEATVGVGRDDEVPRTAFEQRIAMARRNMETSG